ncbi:MAG: hypothetical protein LBT23_01735, partial [Synergistaceae bacterium]|nr:hypothetical protein [Synergistaceae bacterium]
MKHKASRGFSLIVVLIIAMVGLAVVGAVVQLVGQSSGAGRTASASAEKYNFLQDAVENGKAKLKSMTDNTDPVPRYTIPGSGKIGLVEDLLITSGDIVSRRLLSGSERGRLGIEPGKNAYLTVRIYDLEYDHTILDSTLGSDPTKAKVLSMIPPSLLESATPDPNIGKYLIRATLDVDDADPSILESAILQSNK